MKLDEELQGICSVGISGHIRPDGDCIGSTLAVYSYIKTYYPKIDVHIYLEEIPNIFWFLAGAGDIEEYQGDDRAFDLFLVLDCGDEQRLGKHASLFERAKKTICVDHHVSNQAFADKNLVVPDASSTSELVYGILQEDRITPEIAACIYTGIIHDTGVFQYSCTSPSTMEIAGRLMALGIDYPDIVDKTFYEKTFVQNKILGRALLNSRLYEKEKCIASVITKEEMEETGVLPKHLEGIVNQLRITKEADVAIFLYQLDEKEFKVSTRCKSDAVDLSLLAQKYHGGGHRKAAGFSVAGEDPWLLVKQIVADVAACR